MKGKGPDFYSALSAYAAEGCVPLHMPGHKAGRGFPFPELAAIGRLDYTELPGLDDWHRPDGVLMAAQQQLAAHYGAEASYFLVNGATSGLHALLMALGSGSRVLLPRQAHRSLFGGMVLAGTHPVYLAVNLDSNWGLPLLHDTAAIAEILANQPLSALIVNSPSYYGTCGQEAELVELAHQADIPAIFDEAHGAHFGFHPAYPAGALKNGADAVVHGVHKTLPALTGAACIHLAGRMMELQPQVVQALDLLITTSPSQPLMASLEWAHNWVNSEQGWQGLEEMYQYSAEFDRELEVITGIERIMVPGGTKANDPGRVTIGITRLSLDGYKLDWLLRREYGIQVEMAGSNHIVALFTPFNSREEWQTLLRALTDIGRRYSGKLLSSRPELPPEAPLVLTPREAYFAARRRVLITEAAGLVSGELVAAYPPGIPCLLPGETITREMVDYMQWLPKNGGRVQGMLDQAAQYIYVIDM